MALRAASLVKSYLSLSDRTYIILAISSDESTALQTLTRSAAAMMLRFFTSWSMSTLFSFAKTAV